MRLTDGHLLRLGDRVSVGWDLGTVVCSLDTDEFGDRYPASEWRYLEAGVLIDFPRLGLVHYTEPDDDLHFVAHEGDLRAQARAWIAYHQRAETLVSHDDRLRRDEKPDPDWWAVDELMGFTGRDPDKAVQVIDLILSETTDAWVLTNLGAGPIEDLCRMADPAILGQLEAVAACHAHSRTAFESVWSEPGPAEDMLNRVLFPHRTRMGRRRLRNPVYRKPRSP